MDKDIQHQKKFLEQKLQWAKEQDQILAEIEERLYKMKEIAEFARSYKLSSNEKTKLNARLNELKQEVLFLEKQLQSMVH